MALFYPIRPWVENCEWQGSDTAVAVLANKVGADRKISLHMLILKIALHAPFARMRGMYISEV